VRTDGSGVDGCEILKQWHGREMNFSRGKSRISITFRGTQEILSNTFELQCLAKRIVSLCCSASSCERNWSTFAHVYASSVNLLFLVKLMSSPYISFPFCYVGSYQEKKSFRT
jgi:hypothetical protein